MYNLEITEHADRDLESIVSYMVWQLAAPGVATGFLDSVAECYVRLSENPLIYERCRNERLAQDGYRRALVGNYVLLFKVNETAKTTIVYRVFHGSQDYPQQI